jgi:hypothetical protein
MKSFKSQASSRREASSLKVQGLPTEGGRFFEALIWNLNLEVSLKLEV